MYVFHCVCGCYLKTIFPRVSNLCGKSHFASYDSFSVVIKHNLSLPSAYIVKREVHTYTHYFLSVWKYLASIKIILHICLHVVNISRLERQFSYFIKTKIGKAIWNIITAIDLESSFYISSSHLLIGCTDSMRIKMTYRHWICTYDEISEFMWQIFFADKRFMIYIFKGPSFSFICKSDKWCNPCNIFLLIHNQAMRIREKKTIENVKGIMREKNDNKIRKNTKISTFSCSLNTSCVHYTRFEQIFSHYSNHPLILIVSIIIEFICWCEILSSHSTIFTE